MRDVREKTLLITGVDMLENVERERRVEPFINRTIANVVDPCIERPIWVTPSNHVLDEDRIEVDRCHHSYRLLHNSGPERVSTTHFEHALSTRQHLRDELIS